LPDSSAAFGHEIVFIAIVFAIPELRNKLLPYKDRRDRRDRRKNNEKVKSR